MHLICSSHWPHHSCDSSLGDYTESCLQHLNLRLPSVPSPSGITARFPWPDWMEWPSPSPLWQVRPSNLTGRRDLERQRKHHTLQSITKCLDSPVRCGAPRSILRECLHHFSPPPQLSLPHGGQMIHLSQSSVHATLLIQCAVSVTFSRTWARSLCKVPPRFGPWSSHIAPTPRTSALTYNGSMTFLKAAPQDQKEPTDPCPLSSAHLSPITRSQV